MNEPLPPVSRTALGVAGLRAIESARSDRLFTDPYAGAFVGAGKALFPAPEGPTGHSLGRLFYPHVVVRTRFYDEYLTAAVMAGCTQVVLLAAGLDARAFRLDWPSGTRLFELDLPGVLEFKDQVLDDEAAVPRCARRVVPVDLREDWGPVLRASGFDPAQPTAWLAEGLLVYLSFDEASRLLGTVGELSGPGSRLALEHRTDSANTLLSDARLIDDGRVSDLWQGGLGEKDAAWLTEHGWTATTHERPSPERQRGNDGPDRPYNFLTAIRA
ncbi:MAG TPA: class I SAM-dependent methyltransferase [Pseudonocardiaceae bacterium]|nr:class I SAM-dependent methyltransferase [Pseudonocardiaceae bacterium]